MKTYRKFINGEEQIKTSNYIVIIKNGMTIYNPTEEMIYADGWEDYEDVIDEPTKKIKNTLEIVEEIILDQYNNRNDISNEEALDRAIVIYSWNKYINKSLKKGQVVSWNNLIYRTLQDIDIVLEIYPPSITTASLYEVVELLPTGTIDDPIPYTPPMEIYKDKYYIEEGDTYQCIRDSQTILTHNLSDLIGIYVNKIN